MSGPWAGRPNSVGKPVLYERETPCRCKRIMTSPSASTPSRPPKPSRSQPRPGHLRPLLPLMLAPGQRWSPDPPASRRDLPGHGNRQGLRSRSSDHRGLKGRVQSRPSRVAEPAVSSRPHPGPGKCQGIGVQPAAISASARRCPRRRSGRPEEDRRSVGGRLGQSGRPPRLTALGDTAGSRRREVTAPDPAPGTTAPGATPPAVTPPASQPPDLRSVARQDRLALVEGDPFE